MMTERACCASRDWKLELGAGLVAFHRQCTPENFSLPHLASFVIVRQIVILYEASIWPTYVPSRPKGVRHLMPPNIQYLRPLTRSREAFDVP